MHPAAFCVRCGQKVGLGRLTIREILYDFWHAVAHVDRSALALVMLLLKRPGYVARDYVDGKRKRYFGPFAFLVISVGISTAAIHLSSHRAFMVESLSPDSVSATSPEATAMDIVSGSFERHMNVVFLLEAPFVAAFSRLLFRRYGINFAEHLVLASYTSGIRSLFSTILVLAAWLLLPPQGRAATYTALAVKLMGFGYFAFAATQFVRDVRWLPALKGLASAVLAWMALMAVMSVVTMASLSLLAHR